MERKIKLKEKSVRKSSQETRKGEGVREKKKIREIRARERNVFSVSVERYEYWRRKIFSNDLLLSFQNIFKSP